MRRTWIAASVATVALAVAGCAPGQTTDSGSSGSAGASASASAKEIDWASFKGKKLTYLYFTDGPDEAATRALLKEFETKSGGTVDLQIVPFADLQQSLQARLAGGNAPDVARLADVTPFVPDLLDLHEYVGAGYEKEFLAGPIKSVLRDGKLVGLPNDLTINGPFVNVDQFTKAGVEVPTKGWKWPEMVAAAKKVQAANGTEAAIAIDKSGHRLSTVLSQYGTTLLKGKEVSLDEAKGTKAIETLMSLVKDGSILKDFWIESGSKYKGANDMFLAGQVPVYISGNWQVAQFAKSAQFTWAAVPNPCEERCGGFPGGKFTVAFSGSKEPAMAAALVQFLNSKESQEKMSQQSMWLPTRQDLVKSGITYPQRTEDMAVFLKDAAATPVDTYESVSSPVFGAATKSLVEEFAKGVSGTEDAATVVKNVKAASQDAASKLK